MSKQISSTQSSSCDDGQSTNQEDEENKEENAETIDHPIDLQLARVNAMLAEIAASREAEQWRK